MIFKKTGGFSNNGQKGETQKPKNHKIQWADSQEMAGCSLRFDGIPFQIVGVKILECQNGPDRNKALKRKEAKKKMQEDVLDVTQKTISYWDGKQIISPAFFKNIRCFLKEEMMRKGRCFNEGDWMDEIPKTGMPSLRRAMRQRLIFQKSLVTMKYMAK